MMFAVSELEGLPLHFGYIATSPGCRNASVPSCWWVGHLPKTSTSSVAYCVACCQRDCLAILVLDKKPPNAVTGRCLYLSIAGSRFACSSHVGASLQGLQVSAPSYTLSEGNTWKVVAIQLRTGQACRFQVRSHQTATRL